MCPLDQSDKLIQAAARRADAVEHRPKAYGFRIAQRAEYLEHLAENGGDIGEAVRATKGMTGQGLLRAREVDFKFKNDEARILGKAGEKIQREQYLRFLRKHCGNASKARNLAAVSRQQVAAWEQDEKFREKVSDIMESFVDDMNEETIRIATGRKAKAKDPQHLRYVLERVDPRWKPEAKQAVVEHRYSGEVAVRSIDDEIKALLSE